MPAAHLIIGKKKLRITGLAPTVLQLRKKQGTAGSRPEDSKFQSHTETTGLDYGHERMQMHDRNRTQDSQKNFN